jgi:hypothetical protein
MKIFIGFLSIGVLAVLTGCADSRPYTEESIIAAQRQAQKSGTYVATPDTGEAPAAAPAKTVAKPYMGENTQHWVHSSLTQGDKIALEDGSVWEIAPGGNAKTQNWVVAQKITVSDGVDPKYPYFLLNGDRNETVSARQIPQ